MMDDLFNCLNTLAIDRKFANYIQSFFISKINNYRLEFLLEIELTNNCRVNCRYCGLDALDNGQELELKRLKEFILACKACTRELGFASLALSLSGGDPLLYSGFKELVKFLAVE